MTFTLVGVSFRYPRAGRDVLAKLDLELPAGGTTAVLGLSGSGKTTLLNLLGLLWEGNFGGTIAYRAGPDKEHRYAELAKLDRAALRRRHFGFVLQSSYLLPHFSCLQNIEVPLALAGWPARERKARVLDLIRRAGGDALLARADASARDVSGGEKQRVAVLRAVAHDPDVLFADEPLSNLDPVNSELVLDVLGLWRRGELAAPGPRDAARPANRPRSLILVTHSLDVAYSFADRFILLRQGSAVLLRDGDRVRGPVLARDDLDGPDHIKRLILPATKD